jgi:putative RecB family exonuclease
MVIYSHSRISTFEQCQLKYKFQYIDKLEPEVEHTIESFLGSCVHDALEWLYNHPLKNSLQVDDILEYYSKKWKEDYSPEIKLVKTEYDSAHYFNLGIKFLIDYHSFNKPFSDNTIATEHKILVKLDKEGKYLLQGYIDRLVHNLDTGRFEVHDYKTGAIKSQKDVDSDRQLALYALGIHEGFPNVLGVDLIWHFLAFNERLKSSRTLEELEQLKIKVLELIKQIESTKNFQANPSILCKWCSFRKYCPLFNGHSLCGNESLFNFA